MSTKKLFLNKDCCRSQTILLVLQFLKVEYKVFYLGELNEENRTKVINQSLTGSIPLLQNEDFFLSGTPTIIKYLLDSDELIKSKLNKDDDMEASLLVEMWVNYVRDNLWVILEAFNTGSEEVIKEAKKDLLNVLNKLNDHLTFKTYMTGSSLTLADLYLCSSLRKVYDKILDVNEVKNFNNVTRLLKLVSNLKQLKAVFGELNLK